MSGCLIELVTVGHRETDIYVHENENRKTLSSIYQDKPFEKFERSANTIQPIPGTLEDGKKSFVIPREGDLLGECYIRFVLDKPINLETIYKMIDNIHYDVGPTTIDSFNGDCMRARASYDENAIPLISNSGKTIILPLRLSTSIREDRYLPLISLAFHQIKIIVEFNDDYKYLYDSITILGEYVILDIKERREMAQTGHHYTIFPRKYQVETSRSFPLKFGVTARDIIIISDEPLSSIKLKINQHNRYELHDALIFQKLYARRYGILDNKQNIYFMPFDRTILTENVNGSLNMEACQSVHLTVDVEKNCKVTVLCDSVAHYKIEKGMLSFN